MPSKSPTEQEGHALRCRSVENFVFATVQMHEVTYLGMLVSGSISETETRMSQKKWSCPRFLGRHPKLPFLKGKREIEYVHLRSAKPYKSSSIPTNLLNALQAALLPARHWKGRNQIRYQARIRRACTDIQTKELDMEEFHHQSVRVCIAH